MFIRKRHILFRCFWQHDDEQHPELVERLRLHDERGRDADRRGRIRFGLGPESAIDVEQSITAKKVSENIQTSPTRRIGSTT